MPYDPATRHRVMASIRKRDTKPELRVRKALHARGMRYRVNVGTLPGTPDIVFTKARVSVQVHGCFWHQHPACALARRPKANIAYWEPKLRRNVIRDGENGQRLAMMGWHLVTVWECETRDLEQLTRVIDTIESILVKHREAPKLASAAPEIDTNKERTRLLSIDGTERIF